MPSLGHLPAGAVKDIAVTYSSDKPMQLKAVVATLKAAQLKMPAGTAASDWDNRITAGSAAAVPEPKLEVASAKEAAPVTMPFKVIWVLECPAAPLFLTAPTLILSNGIPLTSVTFTFRLVSCPLSNLPIYRFWS